MTLSKKRITKVLVRLRGCTGWSAPELKKPGEGRFSRVDAQIISFSGKFLKHFKVVCWHLSRSYVYSLADRQFTAMY